MLTPRVSSCATSGVTVPMSNSDCWCVPMVPRLKATSASSRHFLRLSEKNASGWYIFARRWTTRERSVPVESVALTGVSQACVR